MEPTLRASPQEAAALEHLAGAPELDHGQLISFVKRSRPSLIATN
jgi:hypothetical protein